MSFNEALALWRADAGMHVAIERITRRIRGFKLHRGYDAAATPARAHTTNCVPTTLYTSARGLHMEGDPRVAKCAPNRTQHTTSGSTDTQRNPHSHEYAALGGGEHTATNTHSCQTLTPHQDPTQPRMRIPVKRLPGSTLTNKTLRTPTTRRHTAARAKVPHVARIGEDTLAPPCQARTGRFAAHRSRERRRRTPPLRRVAHMARRRRRCRRRDARRAQQLF